MGSSAWKVLAACATVLALAAMVLAWVFGDCGGCVQTAAGDCVPMICHWTMLAVGFVELCGAFSCAGLAFVKCKVGRRWLAVGCMLAQVLTMIMLWAPFMGVCSGAMTCRTMAIVITVLGVLAIIACIVACVQADPEKAERPKRGI